MSEAPSSVKITIFPTSVQGRGAFDGGRITEYKPIGFPGEGQTLHRVGPLFYWAWATAHEPSVIGLHPHQAFEIMSYVLQGEIGHSDTLGSRSRVKTGGAQVMQTGSGVSHQEEMLEADTQFFQIWFEPYLREALSRSPTYAEYHADDFPVTEQEGLTIKHIVGGEGPISLVADPSMWEVTIQPDKTWQRPLDAGRSLAVVVISGQGRWAQETTDIVCQTGDFVVVEAGARANVEVTAGELLRLAIVEIPTQVDYPLYRKA